MAKKDDETQAAGEAGTQGAGSKPTPPTPPADNKTPKPVKVRVIVEKGTLGPLLLVKGDETDHPDYVALLEVKGQKKVERVK